MNEKWGNGEKKNGENETKMFVSTAYLELLIQYRF